MCLAIPLRITEVFGKEAMAEIEGVKRKIRIDFVEDAKAGDYVIVHAGFALEKLNEQQAKENMDLIREITNGAMESI